MSGSLIIYSSTDGQTKIICEKIKNFSKNSESIKLISLEEANDFNLQSYENIIIGASIRYGKHNKNLYKFISSNKETLEKKRSAFFSVNVVARKPEKNTPETNPYMKKFLKISNWKPDKLVLTTESKSSLFILISRLSFLIPALLTSISILPKSLITSSTS